MFGNSWGKLLNEFYMRTWTMLRERLSINKKQQWKKENCVRAPCKQYKRRTYILEVNLRRQTSNK